MGFGSLWHWAIVLAVVLILFGKGRIAEIMGDFGKGIKSFKSGLDSEIDDVPASTPLTDRRPAAAPGGSVTDKSSTLEN